MLFDEYTEYFFTYLTGFGFVLLLFVYNWFEHLQNGLKLAKFKIKCLLMRVLLKRRKRTVYTYGEFDKVHVLPETPHVIHSQNTNAVSGQLIRSPFRFGAGH